MAQIPVEKKGGTPWWAWLLGLLVLIGLVLLLIELFDAEPDDDLSAADLDEQVEEDVPADVPVTGAITSLAMILDAPDREALAGRVVDLSGVRVTGVVGDSTFYVTSAGEGAEGAGVDRQFLVALDEIIPAPPPDVEGRYDVTAGQVVDVRGTIEEIETDDPETWGITGQEAERMMDDQIYLRAQELNIVEEANS